MRIVALLSSLLCGFTVLATAPPSGNMSSFGSPPKVPRFSTAYMDRTVSPGTNFYEYAAGCWAKNNPVPADKSRWSSFGELAERNWYLIHGILVRAERATNAPLHSPEREVGNFFASAMDTNRIETLGFLAILNDLARATHVQSRKDFFDTLAYFHDVGVDALFGQGVSPDEKNSSVYAFDLRQGGLTLPDRDYYLKKSFAGIRQKYRQQVTRMFILLGEKPAAAAADAGTVLDIETALAKASRTRVQLRDPDKNYHKFTRRKLIRKYRNLWWKVYLSQRGLAKVPYVIVRQPEFFDALNRLIRQYPLSDWKVYLRWHVLHASAPYLQRAVADENLAFFGKVLSGQKQQEPRWKRAAHVIDGSIGEALGELYVRKYFPPSAKARVNQMVDNLEAVFRDHLKKASWMTEATRAKALAKFDRFTQKIGYPAKFRDYSSVIIRRHDYIGNIRRAAAFEVHRNLVRIGKPVDRAEWHMTPETVNAYFNPVQNEIVFPAGILQPPFFDPTMDDAVNYGAIGVVIAHEITHGFDDQGRKYDASGNLNDWWTDADAKAFQARAEKLVKEYGAFEPLPGQHVNGKLTLGENIADLGGVTIAYDALERDLANHPAKRKKIDGLTPEQRFFISFAQIWRTNIRNAEARRLLTVDPHSPGQFRAIGPLVNLPAFYKAFDIKPGEPMWRPPNKRAKIW